MEKLKDIPGYEGLYKISNNGNVYRIANLCNQDKRIVKGQLVKGYSYVCLCKNHIPKFYQRHRLVALAFIKNPNNLPQVNHKNGNPADNRVENLEWCSASYNAIHSARILNRGKSKLTWKQIETIRLLRKKGETLAELSNKYNVAKSTISRICCFKRRKPLDKKECGK